MEDVVYEATIYTSFVDGRQPEERLLAVSNSLTKIQDSIESYGKKHGIELENEQGFHYTGKQVMEHGRFKPVNDTIQCLTINIVEHMGAILL